MGFQSIWVEIAQSLVVNFVVFRREVELQSFYSTILILSPQIGNFLKQDNNEVPHTNWIFISRMTSLWQAMLFDSILPTELFQNWSQSSQTLLMLYELSFCNILNPYCLSIIITASLPGIVSSSRSQPLCSSMRRNSSSIKFYHEIGAIQSHLQVHVLF